MVLLRLVMVRLPELTQRSFVALPLHLLRLSSLSLLPLGKWMMVSYHPPPPIRHCQAVSCLEKTPRYFELLGLFAAFVTDILNVLLVWKALDQGKERRSFLVGAA